MFTGIVSEVGRVEDVLPIDGGRQLTIRGKRTAADIQDGDSVAVDGVCLTVVLHSSTSFSVQIVDESLGRSALGNLVRGNDVNLERPMRADGRFDGHIVQGHVDGVGVIASLEGEGGATRIRVKHPSTLGRYIVEKGSITVDGTSLTVTAVCDRDADPAWFEVVLIPHTLSATVFGSKEVDSPVNIEVDVIAKYVERMIGTST
ncbi:MAG: riboflavin synthase [Actinomycetia bacterium]|nr:riboflavin synthase [Actinomycetes bacterium]